MPRKHLIAEGISKKQQQQAKIWMKIANEIKTAAKLGGSNIEANLRLKFAIDKAIENNLPKESIEKNITSAQKDVDVLQKYELEAYGFNGLAIIINALTDNHNRLLSSVRKYLNKFEAQLSKANSAKQVFAYKGLICVVQNNYDEEQILEFIIDFQIFDLNKKANYFEIIVEEKDFYYLVEKLKQNQFKIIKSELKYLPLTLVDLNGNQFEKFDKFLKNCYEDEDIESVYHNFGKIKEN